MNERFKAVLYEESEAIRNAAKAIEDTCIDRALQILLECTGRVIVSGAGKSGLIGRKVAATLASTGTAAFYLHPSDAMHGDIGVVRDQDVAVLISQSGESNDLVALIPHLKSKSLRIISLVGNTDSTIGRISDVIFSTAVAREACPLDLAPTSSTAVALAIGDAIAMQLLENRQFTRDDFARNHPSGRLGRRLTVRIEDIMHSEARNPVLSVEASFVEIVNVLCCNSLGAVNIINSEGQLIGLVTDGDIRRSVRKERSRPLHSLTAGMIMTKNPTTTFPSELAYDALRKMQDRPAQISVLPVIDAKTNRCLGLVRLHDVLQSGVV